MYECGVPEKLIKERTGHRSLEGLRSYERSSIQQYQAASKILSTPGPASVLMHSSNKSTSSHISQPSIPGVCLQNLHGCTINIMQAPSSVTTQRIDIDKETEIDQLFADVPDF